MVGDRRLVGTSRSPSCAGGRRAGALRARPPSPRSRDRGPGPVGCPTPRTGDASWPPCAAGTCWRGRRRSGRSRTSSSQGRSRGAGPRRQRRPRGGARAGAGRGGRRRLRLPRGPDPVPRLRRAPAAGIFADLFGEEHARAYIEARTANRFDEARQLSAAAWARLGVTDPGEKWALMQAMVKVQYEELFDAMPSPGAADVRQRRHPGAVAGLPARGAPRRRRRGRRGRRHAMGLRRRRPGQPDADARTRSPRRSSPRRWPRSGRSTCCSPTSRRRCRSSRTTSLARRFEVGSRALLEYVREVQPRYHLFGHVHQPLAARTRIGRTECVNVGHFHGTRPAVRPRPPERREAGATGR